MESVLTAQEQTLLNAFRKLPPEAATEMSGLMGRLAALAAEHEIDWSDSWSEDDLRDFRAASLRRLEASEAEDAA